jgi:hypothetical protein
LLSDVALQPDYRAGDGPRQTDIHSAGELNEGQNILPVASSICA